jgi:hypothetical protein
MNRIPSTLLSFAVMQAGWFACVAGSAHGHPWLGPGVVSAGLAHHVATRPRTERAGEVAVLALAALLGFVVDTALLRGGAISLGGAAVSPPWLVALWPNLAAATAREGSLDSLERRPVIGALLGLIGGPLAYDGGAHLGAMGFSNDRLVALAIIGAAWSPVLPLLFWIRARVRREYPGGAARGR